MKRKIISISILICVIFALLSTNLNNANAAKTVHFKKNKVVLTIGKSIQNPLCNTKKKKKIVYKSANKKIATVTQKGKITAKKAGKTKITATYQKKKYKCTVTVKKTQNKTSITNTPIATAKTTPTVVPTMTVTQTAEVTSTITPIQTEPAVSTEPVLTSTPTPVLFPITPTPSEEPEKSDIGELKITYIDVGQADSTLIQAGGYNILVDCGNDEDEDLDVITKTLNENGVKTLDAVILTHWHEDHIGCFRYLPSRYTIKSVYIRENINNVSTKIYEYTMESIEEHNIETYYSKAEDIAEFGNMQLQFVGPVAAENYNDENANSIAFVLQFGENKFFFGGDTTQEGETDILNQYSDIIVDIDCYKVNHHGSTYSNSYSFIRQLTGRTKATLDERPFYAIVSCGLNNEYFHPHQAVLDRLNQAQAKIYRTDTMGTICVTSDGKTISISTEEKNTQPSIIPTIIPTIMPTSTPEPNKTVYIGNKNSLVVHNSTCSNLPAEKNRIYFYNLEEALDTGYHKCGICFKE